jgi:DinB family protein
MNAIAGQLEFVVREYLPQLKNVPADEFSYKPAPGKWSKKEILGHLVDSAQNNIRRFIVAQYEDRPKIVYNQDKWVAINNYQHYDSAELIQLWQLLNKQICEILRNSSQSAQRETQTEDVHTLEWLAADYIRHMLHHLHQVLNLEPVNY